MKTPYIAGRVQPKIANIADNDTRAQELRGTIVRERINHKQDLQKLAEEYEERLADEIRLRCIMADTYADTLRHERWFWFFLCMLVMFIGLIVGEALAR